VIMGEAKNLGFGVRGQVSGVRGQVMSFRGSFREQVGDRRLEHPYFLEDRRLKRPKNLRIEVAIKVKIVGEKRKILRRPGGLL
jgi:hypothetical protein